MNRSVGEEISSPADPHPAGLLEPTAPRHREPILDVLRGFAVLGILLVNIEFMRGPALLGMMAGGAMETGTQVDRAVHFAVGWLASGKFMASFALLFGVGAAIMAARAAAADRCPRRLLARRYGWLLLIGIAHMVLLFPGDILFGYGLAGLALLLFVKRSQRVVFGWAMGILAAGLALGLAAVAITAGMPVPAGADAVPGGMAVRAGELRSANVDAYTDGSYLDIMAVHARYAAYFQGGGLIFLPWTLALFLVGYGIGRTGVLRDLSAARSLLTRAAAVGLGVGLPLNFVMGPVGPVAATAEPASHVIGWVEAVVVVAQVVGAPLLALGYLAGLALLCLRWPPIPRLAAVGRMALTGYLLQSALALLVFAGFGLYGRLGAAEALLVAGGIWAVLLLVCPWWLRRFRFGPAEWLWRSLTYGRRQEMRIRPEPTLPAHAP